MPELTISEYIDAPVANVWAVLDDFGDIQRWNPGVVFSEQTSAGAVAEGTTRHCDLKPFGAVEERISHHDVNSRMTVVIHSASKLPISNAVADFTLVSEGEGTRLTLNYRYTLNLLGRVTKRLTATQLEKGIGGLATSLKRESERIGSG